MDGRVSAAQRREVEAHLAACPACRTRVEQYGRLWIVLEEAPAIEPSLSFDARVRQRVGAEPRPRPFAWLVPAPRLAFSVALLVVLSAWISTFPPTTMEPPTVATQSEQDFRMIKDLGVLENYDVLSNLDVLSEVSPAAAPAPTPSERQM